VAYRLAGRARVQVDRILTESARKFGREAAGRYYRLMLAAFAALADRPVKRNEVSLPPGVMAYPLALARRSMPPEERVGHPRHIVLYRVSAGWRGRGFGYRA
jgi:plasmid stabilization system protein ParE